MVNEIYLFAIKVNHQLQLKRELSANDIVVATCNTLRASAHLHQHPLTQQNA